MLKYMQYRKKSSVEEVSIQRSQSDLVHKQNKQTGTNSHHVQDSVIHYHRGG